MSKDFELPSALVKRLNHQFGEELASGLMETVTTTVPPVSLRINPKKLNDSSLELPVPWSQFGYYLKERPVFTKDPLLHAGAYYVQEASSMILEQLFIQSRPTYPVRVLDLCAAPGGKSTHLLSLLNKDDFLVANEVIQSRVRILMENLVKWGSDQVVITSSDSDQFSKLRGFFDVLVVDAPCSGEGLIRKDPGALKEWSEDNIRVCHDRQKRILASAWESLAEDGVLIYSTCTYSQEENEDILRWLIDKYDVAPTSLNLSAFEGIYSYEENGFSGYKMLPCQMEGEGFCFFVLKKVSGPPRWEPNRNKKRRNREIKLNNAVINGLKSSDEFVQTAVNPGVVITRFPEELQELSGSLKVVKSGILVGEMKKDRLIPAHEWALSTHLGIGAFASYSISYEQAINFLMKEPFEVDISKKGFCLLLYQNTPLGWINHLGNRFNSLYPRNWRIQRDFRKETPFSLVL